MSRSLLSSRLATSVSARLSRNAASAAVAAPARLHTSASWRFYSASAPQRIVSAEERAALRKARREMAAKRMQNTSADEAGVAASAGDGSAAVVASKAGSGSAASQFLASRWIWYLGLGVPTALLIWGYNDENSPPAKLAEMSGLAARIRSLTDEIAKPSHEKLLPDWSQMPNVPHDIPIPHTLVLDLENTLVSSTWDRKYGWRHAKRPGVDKFLMDLAQYYEIVLYSPSIDAIADPVVNSLDKSGCIMHRLYRDATYYTNGVHVKDLSRLNRNINRMIVIDDDPSEVQFNPENLIRVKPYTDPTDRTDNTLARITPFLIEIAREGYSDIPAMLRQYEGMDADEIADEQERRLERFKQAQEERASRGLSGLARSARRSVDMAPDMEPQLQSNSPSQLTSKDLVGAPPPSASSNSGLVGFLNRRQQEKEENDRRKYEKWHQVMIKKQKEKEEKAKSS